MDPQKIRYEYLGLAEQVDILGGENEISVLAKVDTGADRTAVDLKIAKAVDAAQIGQSYTTRHPSGISRKRELIRIGVRVRGEIHVVNAAVDDRSNMTYPVLLGNDILTSGRFVIIPSL